MRIFALGLGLSGPAMAQVLSGSQEPVPFDAHKAAVDSLATFSTLNAAPGANASSPSEKQTLGSPLRDYIIGLDSLKAWDGKDPNHLLKPTGRFVYPITSNGEVESEVTLSNKHGNWQAVDFSDPTQSKITNEIRKKLGNDAPGGGEAGLASIQVRIPAMNVIFLAQEEKGQLRLTSVQSLPEFGIESGQSYSAQTLLHKLQPFAKRIDSEMPN